MRETVSREDRDLLTPGWRIKERSGGEEEWRSGGVEEWRKGGQGNYGRAAVSPAGGAEEALEGAEAELGGPALGGHVRAGVRSGGE